MGFQLNFKRNQKDHWPRTMVYPQGHGSQNRDPIRRIRRFFNLVTPSVPVYGRNRVLVGAAGIAAKRRRNGGIAAKSFVQLSFHVLVCWSCLVSVLKLFQSCCYCSGLVLFRCF